MSTPNIIFGSGSLGSPLIGKNFCNPEQVQELLNQLKALGITRIDSAARYSPGNPGGSETLLGQVRAADQGFIIDTKINITNEAAATGFGSLTGPAIAKSLDESFKRLNVDKVNILYFHRSDPQTPVAEQAAEIHKQYQAGRFNKFGVSNFTAEELTSYLAVCEEEGYLKPSVYQGRYNLVSREPEEDIFPLLRKHGIIFNAYSPLAAGFLTGRATQGETEGTRFSADNPVSATVNGLYGKPEMHAAIKELLNTIEPLQISSAEACFRWLFYHSLLNEGDGVILGASRVAQLPQNIESISKGPLPVEVVSKIDKLWDQVRE